MVEDIKKEGSTVGAIKGFSSPFGSVPGKKKKEKKNPSKPYGEAELFESAVIDAVIEDRTLEVVRKRGNQWILYDDDTNAQIGVFQNREDAWERQRRDRIQKAAQKKSKRAEREKQIRALTPTLTKQPAARTKAKVAKKSKIEKPKLKVKPQVAEPPKRLKYKTEDIVRLIKPMLKESMISYVFENTPISDESLTWEKFVSKLSKETVMSDPKLKKILQNMAKSEAKLLGKAVNTIKQILEITKSFSVKQGKVDQDPATGDIKLNFVVHLKDNNVKLPFAIKVENGRPLILFPDQSRQAINELGNDESKLLRAEMMHSQETALDHMDDVVVVTNKRDTYLKSLEIKIDKLINNINPLELSMLKYLLKSKYRK